MSFNECQNVLDKYDINLNTTESFLDFVHSKIVRNTKNRFVDKTDNSVDIILSNHPCIKVIPIVKQIDKKNISVEEEISQAIEIVLNSEFQYVYFVYPKYDDFNKHIEVKIKELDEACSDYMVKIIPYSLEDLKKTKRRCNGNSNILCK